VKDFNNQVDKMTWSLDTSKLLFPITPVISEWTYEQNGFVDRGRGYPRMR